MEINFVVILSNLLLFCLLFLSFLERAPVAFVACCITKGRTAITFLFGCHMCLNLGICRLEYNLGKLEFLTSARMYSKSSHPQGFISTDYTCFNQLILPLAHPCPSNFKSCCIALQILFVLKIRLV